jgi:regulation of enolase protein 1 (concanavalin A-like superfamily)/uncharacterized protein (DUF2141 family)
MRQKIERRWTTDRRALLFLVLLFLPVCVRAQNILEDRFDGNRTSANLNETTLTTANVNVNQFGRLFNCVVDGQIYAQPLYVSGLSVAGLGIHNVVFVATEHNSVYAFDADSSSTALWHVNLGTSAPQSVINCNDISIEYGITSTPVIDMSTQTMYVVNQLYVSNTLSYQIHALDITNGQEKFGGPKTISASVAGSGDGNINGQISFDAGQHLNRPGLVLASGSVYACFGSHCDHDPYHGWIIAYNAQTLQRSGVFVTTPNGGQGAIWQGGTAPCVDSSGNLYVVTGNGTFDANTGGSSYSDSVIKLNTSGGGVSFLDYFTPFNQADLSAADLDLGSGGLLLLPGTNFAVLDGKQGTIYLLNRSNLGGFNATSDQVVQEFTGTVEEHANNPSPAYWNGPAGTLVYYWSASDVVKAFKFNGSTFQTTPVAKGTSSQTPAAGAISLSANGATAGSGIVWGTSGEFTGTVRAYDASNVGVELWNSNQNSARDALGNYTKFGPPVAVNGKVYVPTTAGYLAVYGLLSNSGGINVSITNPTQNQQFTAPANINITVDASSTAGAITKVDFFSGTTLLGTATTAPYSFAWNNVVAGTYSLTAVATDSTGSSLRSTAVQVIVNGPGGSLPSPWSDRDIGSVGIAGTASFGSGTFAVTASGVDIWNAADSFHFVYQPLVGDCQIVAHVASVQNTDQWAKAGVMIRQDFTPGSVHAMVAVTPANGVVFQNRPSNSGISFTTTGAAKTAPYWVKIVRSGNTFTGFQSADNVTWVQIGSSVNISMSGTVYIGLALTSHNNTVLNTSNFDSVTVQGAGGNSPPTVTLTSPANGANFAAGSNITLSATAADGDGTVSKVDFFNGATKIGTVTSSPYNFTWNNVAAGSYTLSAVATDNLNATATSNLASITVGSSGGGLPVPWIDQDIGSVGVAGSATFAGGTFTVKGSGVDIWNASDSFNFVYQPISGDGQIVARVASIQNTDQWAKAAVMIRQSLTPDSTHAMVAVTPGNGIVFQRRLTTTGISFSTSGGLNTAPYWVKVVRSGSTFTGFQSTDGTTWVQVGSDTISMSGTVYIGLALSAHNNTALNTSNFDSVAVQSGAGNNPPTVSLTSPANGANFTAGSNITLSATASDSDGTVSKVDFFNGATKLGTVTANPYNFTWNNVTAGNYTLSAVATDNLNATTTSNTVSITVGSSGGALPAPWLDQDIGGVGIAGSANFSSGTFTVKASGVDIWNASDSFHFVYQPLDTDGTITARVATVQNTDQWAKAAVMVRQSLTPNSPHAMMAVSSQNGLVFQRRLTASAVSFSTTGVSKLAPYWVRVVRSGNTLTGYQSSDGATWVKVDSVSISFTGRVYIGLALTAHNNTALNTSTFDNVSVTTP